MVGVVLDQAVEHRVVRVFTQRHRVIQPALFEPRERRVEAGLRFVQLGESLSPGPLSRIDDLREILLIGNRVDPLALEPGNHRAILCDRPELALDLAVNERVDAVVLDIMMPGMTGFEVLQAFKDDVFARGIPVLILSALGDASDRVRGLREGARDYLVKPFDVDELLLRVENLLAQRSRPGAVLEGSLSCLHLADVLHQVVESQASGLLEIRTGGAPAQITLGFL